MALAAPPFDAELSTVATDAGWLKLGHYEKTSDSKDGWISAIHSDEFFLSPDGKTNPLQELRATLAAFSETPGDNPDQHAQCRFPARHAWLTRRLGAGKVPATSAACTEYAHWTRSNSVSSLSIVFATGFLGNPASYYGHTLLKFNFANEASTGRLLDVSVNYGAISNKDDGVVTYIAKSLTGGYDGGFSHIGFYFHTHNYGDIELRDLWEYKLSLPSDAVELIVAHAWELLGKRFTYDFFRENCGYRMAELLQIADGVQVMPDHWPWIIPQAIVAEVGRARYQDKPLLDEVIYHPSRQSRFYARHRLLSSEQAKLVGHLVDKPSGLNERPFQSMPHEVQRSVLDTLMDYYQFVGAPIEIAPPPLREAYTQALARRYQLPPGSTATKATPPPSPHLSRPLGWLQAAASHHSAWGNTLLLRIRPAYYDTLDSESGQVRNGLLTMGDTQLMIHDKRISLRRLDLFGVENANPGRTGLAGDSGGTWKLHAGLEQQRLACESCLVGRFQGDIGHGGLLARGLFGAVYLGGALQTARNGQGNGFVRTTANLIFRPRDDFALRTAHELRVPLNGQSHAYSVSSVEGRWALKPDVDVRLAYDRDNARLVSLGIGLYW